MTKEEQPEKVLIYSIERNGNPYFGAIQYGTALEAMDIYAKEVAIEFAEWVAKNGWYLNKIQRWSNRGDKSDELLLVITSTKSTEQLYELFLQSKNQNQ